MPEAPPSVKRPACAAATPVEPKKYESGSTTVLCWLDPFVNGSLAILMIGMVALAARLSTSAAAAARLKARAARLRLIWVLLWLTTGEVYYAYGTRGKQKCALRQG